MEFKKNTYDNYIYSINNLLKKTKMDKENNKYELLDAFIWYKNRNKQVKDGKLIDKNKKNKDL